MSASVSLHGASSLTASSSVNLKSRTCRPLGRAFAPIQKWPASLSAAQPGRQQSLFTEQVGNRQSVCVTAGFGFGKPSKQEEVENKRPCPCGSGNLYKDCCKPYHVSSKGKWDVRPPTAEACLRARFSAYCMKTAIPTVVKTTSKDNPVAKGSVSEDGKIKRSLEDDVKVSMAWVDFKGLNIMKMKQPDENTVVMDVEYNIKQLYEMSSGNKIKDPQWQVIRETSKFVRDPEDGWVFLGADKINWDRQKLEVVQA